jgi:hypothetical protein
MQLQIECNSLPGQQKHCVICQRIFVVQEARVLACNEQGYIYGEVCPLCLHKGINWLNDQFDWLDKFIKN